MDEVTKRYLKQLGYSDEEIQIIEFQCTQPIWPASLKIEGMQEADQPIFSQTIKVTNES